jgi:predicted dehydrogenase
MERIDELQAAVKKSGSKTLVGFQFRFHPGMIRAKQLIEDGEIGRVVSAHVHFGEYLPAWHPWEDYRKSYAARADMGGGVVLTQCHSLDYLPWLVGDVESLWGSMAKLSDLDVDVDDTAKIGLRFETGALGSIHLDYNQQPPAHYYEVVGTQGSLQWNLSDGATRIYRAEKKDWEAYPLPIGWERNIMFMEEMKHFLAVARGEVESSCSLKNGIRVQRLIEAIRQSQDSGCIIHLQEV